MALLRLFFLLLLAPVLVVQAVRVRRATPRLPGAAGPVVGTVGAGVPLRIAVLGESTVDGVGAATHTEALTGQLAQLLAEDGREVRWQAVGRSGATAGEARRELVPRLQPADLLVVVLGVNDTLELRSPSRFRRDLLGIIVEARRRIGEVPVLLAGVVPLGSFPALPRPLRDLLGARAIALDRAARELVRLPGVTHVPFPAGVLHSELFAADRFHPGPSGYREWALVIAECSRPVTFRRHLGEVVSPFGQHGRK